jgi:hypothetical protein
VLADVAQEVEQRHRTEPVAVVEQLGSRLEQTLELGPDGGHVGLDLVSGEQVPLGGLTAGVADHPGGAAGQVDDLVPGPLEPAQRADPDQVADLQARGGRVEADVGDEAAGVEQPGQLLGVGALVHQPPPHEVVP